MTKEQAIEELKYLKHLVRADSPPDKALDMAIEALKQNQWMKERYTTQTEGYADQGGLMSAT